MLQVCYVLTLAAISASLLSQVFNNRSQDTHAACEDEQQQLISYRLHSLSNATALLSVYHDSMCIYV